MPGIPGSCQFSSHGIRILNTLKKNEVFLVEHMACAVTERSNQSNHPVRSKQQLLPETSNLPLKPIPAKDAGCCWSLLHSTFSCCTDLSQLCTDSWWSIPLKTSFHHLVCLFSLPAAFPDAKPSLKRKHTKQCLIYKTLLSFWNFSKAETWLEN